MPSTDLTPTQKTPDDRSDCGPPGSMQHRLAQLCQQIEQGRSGSPETQTGMPGRIEQGAATPSPSFDAESPWDAETAEALTRVYELAAAELRGAPPPRVLDRPIPAMRTDDARQPDSTPGHDRAWLEQRFAEIAALVASSLADTRPERSVSVLSQRLDQFEQRLESALDGMRYQPDTGTLSLIETHIRELTSQFEATRGQLNRLDAVDEQLRDLAHMIQERREPQQAAGDLSIETLKALIDTAAERGASQAVAAMPSLTSARDEGDHTRIEALEALLQDYVAERRRGEDVAAGILQSIEEALGQIVDRIDAIEAAKAEPASGDESDGLAMESERLAEAYAAGARVLGQNNLESSLDAADYVEPMQREESERAADAPVLDSSGIGMPASGADQDAEMRRELRASAMRAKLKAQAPIDAPMMPVGIAPDEIRASSANRARSRTASSAASQRFSLLLIAAMMTLFGTSYMAVDALLGSASNGAPATETTRPKVQPTSDQQPARQEPGKAGRAPDHVLRTGLPEEVDAGWDRSLTQINLAHKATPSPEAPVGGILPPSDASQAPGADIDPPLGVGTAALRHAAAKGDPGAQFEVASRIAEGRGVAPDPGRAVVWFQRAAMRGHVPAQFRLGTCFERGIGVAADAERAKVWYRRAAEHGHPRAMHNLAVLTVGEDKTDAGYAAAAQWFTAAANRGLTDSQFNIGLLHEHGQGVARSPQEAYKWYALAARGGDKEAARRLEKLKARLAAGELATAEKSLAHWLAHPAIRDAGG